MKRKRKKKKSKSSTGEAIEKWESGQIRDFKGEKRVEWLKECVVISVRTKKSVEKPMVVII